MSGVDSFHCGGSRPEHYGHRPTGIQAMSSTASPDYHHYYQHCHHCPHHHQRHHHQHQLPRHAAHHHIHLDISFHFNSIPSSSNRAERVRSSCVCECRRLVERRYDEMPCLRPSGSKPEDRSRVAISSFAQPPSDDDWHYRTSERLNAPPLAAVACMRDCLLPLLKLRSTLYCQRRTLAGPVISRRIALHLLFGCTPPSSLQFTESHSYSNLPILRRKRQI